MDAFQTGWGRYPGTLGSLINGDFMNGDLRMNILLITTGRVCDVPVCGM